MVDWPLGLADSWGWQSEPVLLVEVVTAQVEVPPAVRVYLEFLEVIVAEVLTERFDGVPEPEASGFLGGVGGVEVADAVAVAVLTICPLCVRT